MGKKKFQGIGPEFSPWLPLKNAVKREVEENGKKVIHWVSKFDSDQEITIWGLRKFCHWEASIDLIQAGGLSVIGGGFPVPSLQTIIKAGTFAYKIVSPSGKVVMHQKVYLSINMIVMVMSSMGLMNLADFVWTMQEDRSFIFRSRRARIKGGNPDYSLDPPIVLGLQNPSKIDEYSGEILVRLNETPQSILRGLPATKISVERATLPSDQLESKDIPSLGFEGVGDMVFKTENGTSFWEFKEFPPSKGEVYMYRINVEGAWSDAISVVAYGPSVQRSRIETYVIAGKPTTMNPDLTISGKDRLTYDEYAPVHVWFVKGREETLYLDPASGTQFTNLSATIDCWWNSPIYEVPIPPGSELILLRDAFASNPNATVRDKGNGKEWQFSYKGGKVAWSSIKTIANKLVSAQKKGNGVSIVSGEIPAYDLNITTTKVQAQFFDGQSAFLIQTDSNEVYCCLSKGVYTELLVSSNGGNDFTPLGSYEATNGVGKKYIANAKLFNGKPNYTVLDLIKDGKGGIYILAENSGYLYVQTTSSEIGGFQEVSCVGRKKDATYRFTDYKDAEGVRNMTVTGTSDVFLSSDGGRTWISLTDDLDKFEQNIIGDDSYSLIDSHVTKKGKRVILAEKLEYLYVQVTNDKESFMMQVGKKIEGNSYRMNTSSEGRGDDGLVIVGGDHRFISTNGGSNWKEINVVGV